MKTLLLIAACLFPLASPGQERLSVRRTMAAMGTELVIEAQGPDTNHLASAINAAEAEIRRIEDMMTTWRDSPLTRLNANAGNPPQAVPTELAEIIARAKEVHAVTDKAFDITFFGVGSLWDFKADTPSLPEPETIRTALTRVGAGRIVASPDTTPATVTLPKGMAIGLGGIAKGYAVDQAMKRLRTLGVQHALVNAGGDMKALGDDQGAPWEVAVKHPRDPERAVAAIKLRNQSMVTSGDYERFFEIDGKRYHHILDPRTGYPATGCMSASIVTFNAEFADALATACCVLGPENGLALLEKLPRVEGILIGMDGSVRLTSGLEP